MSQLTVAALVRNEQRRYWRSALAAWEQFADKIVVLDDGSTDKTLSIAEKHEKVSAYQRTGDFAWGAESVARRELFDIVFEETSPGDYVLWLDADMVPLADPRELTVTGADTVYFPLYDLWGKRADGKLLYREDALWRAHFNPRAWMIRRPRDFKPEWMKRGLHCGHLPLNWTSGKPLFAPPSHALLHYSYFDEADRHEKAAAYLRCADQLTFGEVEHARSIVDETPALKPLFETPRWELEHA